VAYPHLYNLCFAECNRTTAKALRWFKQFALILDTSIYAPVHSQMPYVNINCLMHDADALETYVF